MKTKKINEVRKQIEYEYKRNSYPDGFPKIPDISGKRYTDQEFFDLEFKNIFLKSWLMIFREDEIPNPCLLYTSPSPRDGLLSRMPSSA